MEKYTVKFSTQWLLSQNYREEMPIEDIHKQLNNKYQDNLEIIYEDMEEISFLIELKILGYSLEKEIEELVASVVKSDNWKEFVQITVIKDSNSNNTVSEDGGVENTIMANKDQAMIDFSDDEIDSALNDFLSQMGKKSKKEGEKEPSRGNKSKKTGTNSRLSLDELALKYDNLYNILTNKVIGQDMAVMQFVRECFQSEMIRVEGKKGPRSVFLFAGPPGVGKTFLAQTAAENMGVESKLFNMSGYADEKSYIDLVGVSQSFKSPREGDLVKFARENPKGIIIFDEIEKAHITTIRLFLQILDRGVLHNDYLEEDTDFSENIIIFTSNVGKALYVDRNKNLSMLPQEVVLDALRNEKTDDEKNVFPPELCSRFGAGNIVIFNHMNIDTLLKLVRNNFDMVCQTLSKEYDYNITYERKVPLLFLLNLGAKADARMVNGQGTKFLTNEVYDLARHILPVEQNMSEVTDITFEISDELSKDINPLFNPNEKMEILLLGDCKYQRMIDLQKDKYTVVYVDSVDKAKEALNRDISLVLIDPFFELASEHDSILGLDDYRSTGISLLNFMMESEVDIPIYLLSDGQIISTVDQSVLLQQGVLGFIMDESLSSERLNNQIIEITDGIQLQNNFTELTNKGLIVSYETAQILSDDTKKMTVKFYNLKKKTAIDAESQKKIISNAERPTTKLSDVIGAENAKDELKYFINYLKNPKQFMLNGGKKPKGVLLYGPPGTGKTMLARAMAGESSMTFISTSATELMSKYVGEGEKNIRDLFATAKRYAPTIIFIDEIDAIGKKRTGAENAKNSEDMLNALLTEMDGFATGGIKHPVFVLAATNYGVNEGDKSVALDPALVRRFDNKIYVDLPKEKERKQYLDLKLLNKDNKVTEDAINNFAKRTTGKSLAILENVIDLAKRNALKASTTLDDHILQAALEEYNYGEQHKWDDYYYKQVAIHEASHAYICYLSGETPSYVTIVSRGDFGGYMQHDTAEKQPNLTKEQLLWKIKTSLAGRIGEKVFFGPDSAINTGASSDLEHASQLALNMICSLGMYKEQLFAMNPGEVLKSSFAGEYIAKANTILVEQYAECERLVEEGKDKIQALANKLVTDNYITGNEIAKILK